MPRFKHCPRYIPPTNLAVELIDRIHTHTTGGDLGNYLMAGLPNASYLGFTGTPIDKTAYGRGTFKTFGGEDDKGYLHKYSIADSIADGTTLPLYYNLAPNELLVPHDTLAKEFLSLADAEGLADIEHLNKVLDRAVNLKNFLKGKERIKKVAEFVARHYTENVEPLGYKAFLVGVDREACALYKHALDEFLPAEYSEVVYTGNNNDSATLKAFHLDEKKERQIRKAFTKLDQQPKILIVTEKLVTGYDAPVLYAMYLDKPMRDHTLLQAIARVNLKSSQGLTQWTLRSRPEARGASYLRSPCAGFFPVGKRTGTREIPVSSGAARTTIREKVVKTGAMLIRSRKFRTDVAAIVIHSPSKVVRRSAILIG